MILHLAWSFGLLTSLAFAEDTDGFDSSAYQIREILLSVFQSTGGFAWVNSTNWLQQNVDICDWSGVICYPEDYGDEGRVGQIQELNLKDNHLVGTVPSIVFEIPYLETLNLEDNVDVTVDLSNLSQAQFLRELDLSNTLVDSITGIEAASNLEVLHLTGLSLEGTLPSGLFSLSNLAFLYANDNSFSGPLSSNIGRLTALREIYLGNSDLTGQLPDELGSLSLLEVLSLANNAFEGTLPQVALNTLTNLKTIAIQRPGDLPKGNGISGSIPSFSDHSQLTGIYFQHQLLSGSLDDYFLFACPEGETVEVDLRDNQISGSVPAILSGKKYMNLYLAGNQITSVSTFVYDASNGSCSLIQNWMRREVAFVGCDAFMCPPGTWAPLGRATVSDPCTACSDDTTFWGRTSCDSSTPVDVQERQILVNMYNVMGGREWKVDTNWLSLDTSVCDWHGVTCSNGLVSSINLRNNGLSGTPPQELFSMSELRTLNLELNPVSFSFQGISSATNLQVLNLAYTNLSISDLTDIRELASLKNLSVFSIDSNVIGGELPTVIYNLTSLQELNVAHNGFTGTLDTRIGQLTNLKRLYIDGNQLSGQIPSEIGNLVSLEDLQAGENTFGGTLPEQLNQLTNLQSLSLQHIMTISGIGGPMLSFSNLAQLTSLELGSNALTGTLPADLLVNSRNLGSLIRIDLSDNLLEGTVPSQWSRFDRLSIDLTGNQITALDSSLCLKDGWMDGDVGRYSCDAIMCPIGSSNSAGRISDDFSECMKCSNGGTNFLGAKSCTGSTRTFGIYDGSDMSILLDLFAATMGNEWKNRTGWDDSAEVCNFHGVLCDAAGRVNKIDLTDNGLRGSVPSSIFMLSELNELILSKNIISFSFDGIANATSLTTLRLEGINLDSITGISSAPSLANLHLAQNSLAGDFPHELFLLSNLRKLDVGYNQLSGRIPNLIGAMSSLETLSLYHNKFTGRLPAALGDLSNLNHLNLAQNNFEGTIPPEFSDLTNLRFLSLQREGGILGTVDVGINQGDSSALGPGLSGPLPAFDQMPSLFELYLGVNSLTGSIPSNFLDGVTETSAEIKVDLTSNQLTGTIPSSLSQFEDISLFVADNKITGIGDALCSKSDWMNGDVREFQCDGILCPIGTYNPFGRKNARATTCETCPSGSSGYMGSFACLTEVEEQENSDRAILERIYKRMNGENWLDNTNWMDPEASICTWYGITCTSDSNPSVVAINLENNRLLNSLVMGIFNLPKLRILNLKKNDIQVSLFGIQNATSLEYLDLSETGLTSLSGVSLATNLKVLLADGNNITTFPEEVINLVNLETLSLEDNRFPQMVIPNLQSLPNLKYLNLRNCGLMGLIPDWVGGLTNLEYLKLGDNGLMGDLPTALLELTNLRHLDLSDQISNGGSLLGTLPDFSNFTQLSEIFLQHNLLSGTIPSTMLESNSNTELVTLDLRYNSLTGTVPSELSRIKQMNLYLTSNMFTVLPPELCNTNWNDGNTGTHGCDGILCGTGTFNAYGRAIGSLDCMTCDSPFMTSVLGSTTCGSNFEHTALISFYKSTGGPSWKSALNWLELEDHCTWEGITCHTEGEFQGLVRKIELDDNNLVGLADLVMVWLFEGLEVFRVQRNDVVVSFLNIENAINLHTLILSETKTDSLRGIGGAKQLRDLHVTNSDLSGLIPDEVFTLTHLERLYLSHNSLSGSLPTLIGQLTALRDLYIFDNKMRGTIPSEIGLLGKLEHLSLGQNDFVGTIPRQINSLARLEFISLEKEQNIAPTDTSAVGGGGLTGTLPALNGLPKLRQIYLGHNSFTGTIPSDFLSGISDKTQLTVVDLSYNNLSGPIPSSFSKFEDLRLELARNQIGDIPDEICAMTSWYNGEVANGCDAILCFPGTYNEFGRRIDLKTICLPCTYPGSALGYGSVECGPVNVDAMDDRSILMELYDATGGSDWSNSAGWNSETASFCEWFGITCEPEGESGQMTVTEIALIENNLNGIIPSILFHLPALRKLDVRNNEVSVGVGAVFQAKRLEELYLDKTLVSSLEGIGRASSLRVLHLHKISYGWKPIPDELFELAELEDLNLADSMFGGTLSTKVGQLSKLKRLTVVGNALSGQIPSEIGNLVAVEQLDLSNNNWYGTLPGTVSGLTSMTSFGLTNDSHDKVGVSGQLHPFDTMPGLRELFLSNNQFTGSIPDSFLAGVSDNSKLITVHLEGNHLGGLIPSGLASFGRLNIYLENNLFTGFGEGICQKSQWMDGSVGKYGCDAILCPAGKYSPAGRQLSDSTACAVCPDLANSPTLGSNFCLSIQKRKERDILGKLYEGTNGINWRINDNWMDENVDICKWYGLKCKQGSTVESILLGSNGLVGTIPTEIYELPNLKFLWVYSNPVDLSFDGIAKATSLTSLLLDSTKIRSLNGLGLGRSLVDVDVRFNNLSGPIPTELSNLINLESFTCAHNDFTGKVPELTALRKLTTLRMGNNRLTGTLPSFSKHPSLKVLDLSQNHLIGKIPNTLLNSVPDSDEVFLDFSGNSLTGIVPGELSRFAGLTLYLRENQIEGINPNLCEQGQFNNGDVGTYQCDGILCPAGTVSQTGRASSSGECVPCSGNEYFGSTTCDLGATTSAATISGVIVSILFASVGLLLLF